MLGAMIGQITVVVVIHRKTVARAPDAVETPDHGGIVGKSRLDPEQIRRQRQEETRVYGENAYQALFTNHPDAIVRA